MTQCLVVDDSSVIRKIERRMMEAMDFSVVEAEDGWQALEVCHEQMPAVVLLDWNMPNMDGITFLGALRALEGGETPKVIFCTTESDLSFITRALDAGADEYMMKPFDQDTLAGKLSEVGLR